MAHLSSPADLVLHAVRVLGHGDAARIAARFALPADVVEEELLDDEALGLVRRTTFAGRRTWSLTDAGRAEDERRMAAELERAGARDEVVRLHAAFLPFNERFAQACTRWQLRPGPGEPLAANDHTDYRYDDRILDELAALGRALARLCADLSARLARFDAYPDLYADALARAEAGQHAWVDASDRDSLHLLWIQFHEDLLSTLGLPRGSDA